MILIDIFKTLLGLILSGILYVAAVLLYYCIVVLLSSNERLKEEFIEDEDPIFTSVKQCRVFCLIMAGWIIVIAIGLFKVILYCFGV